nr:glycosyltransferase family 9 protein [Legionella jordanis]
MIKSICIVRLSALGDVLMLVPLIRTLQANLAGVSITWVISRPAYDMVEGMPGVDFIVIDKPNSIKDYWRFKKQLNGRSFDVLIAAQASLRANLLYPFIKAERKLGFDTERAKDGHRWFVKETISPGEEHNLESFLKFAQLLGLEKIKINWNLPITEVDKEWARAHLPAEGPILLVNPAASKPERSWPVERYVEVIKEAKKRWRAQVVLTGGPGAFDRKLADAILKQVSCLDLVGKTKPKQLLAVIDNAQALLCPDTGPSHMATAVGTPVVALHAVTNPEISGPYTFRHLVVNRYPQAVRNILKIREEEAWGQKVHGKEAMQLIQVEDVLAKLSLVLNETGSA